jgi:hypothetical protein
LPGLDLRFCSAPVVCELGRIGLQKLQKPDFENFHRRSPSAP